jgi:hypothetical protein
MMKWALYAIGAANLVCVLALGLARYSLPEKKYWDDRPRRVATLADTPSHLVPPFWET